MNASAGYSPVSNSIPATRLSQIEDQSKQLAASLDTLAGSLSNLVQRLTPVAKQASPVDPAGKHPESPREILVPLANDFRVFTDRVQIASSIINDLLQRLELP